MTKHVRTFVSQMAVAALLAGVMLVMGVTPAAAQGAFAGAPPQNQQTFGFTQWGINNQRVASQYNYVIDTRNGLGNNLGLFSFPAGTCQGALTLPARGPVDPLAFTDAKGALPQVRIIDNTSANSETVSQNSAPSFSGSNGNCSLALATSNTHSQGSYFLTSPTCGLREALDDLGTTGGTVIITQEWYALPQGCNQATITGLSGQLLANQYVLDISNGQSTWYALDPTATTLIAAPTPAPTTGTVAGGTFTNGNVLVATTYVDAMGGETLVSSETTQATGGTTNGLTVTSPAASTGAVGYRVYMTAVGGSTGTEVLHTTATNCAQSVIYTAAPTCAIGASTTVLAPITSTSKEPEFGTAHTTIAFQPLRINPTSTSASSVGSFYSKNVPFAAVATITAASSSDVAQVFIPAQYVNFLGASFDVCFKAVSTLAATAVPTWKLNASTAFLQSPVTLTTVLMPTQTGAVSTGGCINITTASTGATGTLFASSTSPLTQALAGGAAVTGGDGTAAASSSIDLTKGIYLTLNLGATTANITAVTVDTLQIRPAPGS